MILAQAFARFVLDLDGVVWRGAKPIPGSPEAIKHLRDAGKRIAFVTNNSSELPETTAKKLSDMGAGGDASEVVSSADATAEVLTRTVPGLRGRACYVIGGEGLRSAVEETGVRLVDGAEAVDASVVVVGWDRKLTYNKLRYATLAIRAGAYFVASNVDPTYPTEAGLIPGNGAAVAALVTATGVRPIVAGKPEPTVLQIAARRLGGEPALMVGDRPDTDLAAAAAVGWPSAMVLTGATGLAELAAAPAWPDFLLTSLAGLLDDLPHPEVRPAVGPDLPPIAQLLHDGDLHVGAARERLGHTVVAEADRLVIGTAAWEPAGDAAMLRSIAVARSARRKGVGMLVAAAALRDAYRAGFRTAYLATADAEAFFARGGFQTVPREGLPDAIAEHPQLTRECPSSAPVMRLDLPES